LAVVSHAYLAQQPWEYMTQNVRIYQRNRTLENCIALWDAGRFRTKRLGPLALRNIHKRQVASESGDAKATIRIEAANITG
jgi:hypothetical protein